MKVLVRIGTTLTVLAFALVVGVGSASAHTTADAASDTPLGGDSQNQSGAVDGYFGALANGEAENSLLRNPTCGAHFSGDGIHPPGNP